MGILKRVQNLSLKIIQNDPDLGKKENILLKKTIEKKFNGKIEI